MLRINSKTWPLFVASSSVLLAACTTQSPSTSGVCSPEAISQTNTPSGLRAIVAECSSINNTEYFGIAVFKLNDLSPVASKTLRLQSPAPSAVTEQVAYELDVYFNPLEAYLSESGIGKLDLFIERLNATYSIKSVRLVGSSERSESSLPRFQLANKRATFVRRYLLAAGMSSDVPIEVLESPPKQPDTIAGRAIDRAVAIKVIAYRRQTTTN